VWASESDDYRCVVIETVVVVVLLQQTDAFIDTTFRQVRRVPRLRNSQYWTKPL
jgi:type IV secretory pathway VirB3-like protein